MQKAALYALVNAALTQRKAVASVQKGIDYLEFMTQIYADQPSSLSDMWNRLEYRFLKGFVYAITL
jgi:hypothetical protein